MSEYLKDSLKRGNITSESIPNAYSVSYDSGNNDITNIQSILELYLGGKNRNKYGYSLIGIAKIVY